MEISYAQQQQAEQLDREEDALLAPVLAQLSDGGAAIRAQLHDLRRRRLLLLLQPSRREAKRRKEEGGHAQPRPELPPELWDRILSYVGVRERLCWVALVCRQWRCRSLPSRSRSSRRLSAAHDRALATSSIKVGALGHRDFHPIKTRFQHRLAFYAQHCGPLVSLDLSYWRTGELGVPRPLLLAPFASTSFAWLSPFVSRLWSEWKSICEVRGHHFSLSPFAAAAVYLLAGCCRGYRLAFARSILPIPIVPSCTLLALFLFFALTI
jgi:hypothetical protein